MSPYLSCYWPDFDQTSKKSSWNPLSQMQTITVAFAMATFVLATFVHIRNISAVTDPILTKQFAGGLNFFNQHFYNQNFLWTKFYLIKFFSINLFYGLKNISTKHFFGHTFLWTLIFLDLMFLPLDFGPTFFGPITILN